MSMIENNGLTHCVLSSQVLAAFDSSLIFRNEPLPHELINFLMDNVCNVTSVRAITETLSSNKSKVDHKTVGKYINAL